MKKVLIFIIILMSCLLVQVHAKNVNLYDSILKNNTIKTLPSDYNLFACTTYGGFDGTQDGTCLKEGGDDPSGYDYFEGYTSERDGLYPFTDDKGKVYVFRGRPNNWVQLGVYNDDYYFYFVESLNNYKVGNYDSCMNEAINPDIYCKDLYKIANKNDKMYWNILRTNGDKSIRLVYAGTKINNYIDKVNIGASAFNTKIDDLKYFGYTYKENDQEVDSSLKKYIENWYNLTMKDDYEKFLTKGTFVNDTSAMYPNCYGNQDTDFCWAGYTRLWFYSEVNKNIIEPTLQKSNSTAGYGGDYNLYVGTLSADETILSGLNMWGYPDYGFINGNFENISSEANQRDERISANYNARITLTPFDYEIRNNTLRNLEVYIADWTSYSEDLNNYYYVLPVINVNTETIFKGDGSVENPYKLYLPIKNNVTLDIKANKGLNILSYFEDLQNYEDEIIWSNSNDKIAKLKDNELVLLSVGTTEFSTEVNGKDYSFTLTVTEEMINPNTNNNLSIIIPATILIVSSIFCFIIKNRKKSLKYIFF